MQCGTVIEENTIVNEVGFGETASGAAMVQGSFVGQGASEWILCLAIYGGSLYELTVFDISPR